MNQMRLNNQEVGKFKDKSFNRGIIIREPQKSWKDYLWLLKLRMERPALIPRTIFTITWYLSLFDWKSLSLFILKRQKSTTHPHTPSQKHTHTNTHTYTQAQNRKIKQLHADAQGPTHHMASKQSKNDPNPEINRPPLPPHPGPPQPQSQQQPLSLLQPTPQPQRWRCVSYAFW